MLESKNLEIITLSENTAGSRRGVLAEWGISMLIKAGSRNILLDTGGSITAVHNADALGVDLHQVETIVLSHGHYDHTGGLLSVLARVGREEVEIIGHPDIWSRKYGKNKKSGLVRYAGIPFSREALESLGARFALTADPTWITEDIVASGEEPTATDFEKVADNLFLKEGEQFIPDPMADDQSVFLKTDLGLILLLGCAHRGVVNILNYARELTGMEQVYLILGGTHLISASEEQITRTIEAFKEAGVEHIGVSHCTGQQGAARLALAFGEGFFYNNAGTVIRFPLKQ
ncbi:MAG: MBL fold metallo-hydrolase [Spirochaeta sp.]|nr:MBL fold metallo-hydrolase [Spirochaeta sp.]